MGIPFLDPIDLRFRSRIKVPVPTTKAVMFCVMDVSGSMDEQRKELSKRFFILLYLFLTRHYDKIELVFIRHHTQAQEVNEHDFFHATETGGTVVSSALTLLDEIIQARYPTSEWNLYVAQASDGDNWHHDSSAAAKSSKTRSCPWCAITPMCRWRRPNRTCGTNTWRWRKSTSTLRCARCWSPRRSTLSSESCSRRKEWMHEHV